MIFIFMKLISIIFNDNYFIAFILIYSLMLRFEEKIPNGDNHILES